jgi:hypothetical protein
VIQFFIAIDQTVNTVAGGFADETLSARAHRRAPHSRRWAITRLAINALFWWQDDHCAESYESEHLRRQLPVEYRT